MSLQGSNELASLQQRSKVDPSPIVHGLQPLTSVAHSSNHPTSTDPIASTPQQNEYQNFQIEPKSLNHQQDVNEAFAESTSVETAVDDSPNVPGSPKSILAPTVTSYQTVTEKSRCSIKSTDPESAPAQAPDPPASLQIPLQREIPFILVIALSHFMTQVTVGQTLVPIQIIGRTFGVTSIGEISWFIAAYSLTVGTFILISGRIGDIIGHKRVFCFGYAWLAAWSAFAGFAAYTKSSVFFDVSRALQGIGPALLMPNGLALYARAYPVGKKKNMVFALFGMMAPVGFYMGALSGSLFAQLSWWPIAFWTYAAASLMLGALSIFVIPRRLGAHMPNKPTFDYPGAVTGVIALVLINLAFNQAPMYTWSSPHVYILLILGLLVFIVFCLVEKRVEYPLLPIQILNSTAAFVLTCMSLGWASFGIWLFYTFRFLMEERLLRPLEMTLQFLPCLVCGILAAIMTGLLMINTPVSFVMMVSMLAFVLGTILSGTAGVHQSYWAQTFLSFVIISFGMDMSFPAASIILSNHFPRQHQGLAMSLVNTVVNYSISIGLGIAATVEVYSKNFKTDPESNLKGIRAAFYTSISFSCAAFLCGATFFVISMRKHGWKVPHH